MIKVDSLKNKWASLEESRTDRYLLEPLDAFNIFIGINPSGRRILALDIKNISEVNLDYFPSWTGAPVEHKAIENRYYLIITLMDDDNANILDDLIHNLVLRFEKITTIDNALDSFPNGLSNIVGSLKEQATIVKGGSAWINRRIDLFKRLCYE